MTNKKVLEAALFISSEPLMLDQLARVSGIKSLGHLKELMESLQKDYGGRGIEIVNTRDGWSMQVRQELLPRVAHLTPYSDLAEGPKRTLALVTLKEPVKQSEIIKTQGNKAYSYIKELKKRGLVITEKQGHTKMLKLTQEFERYFGQEKAIIKEQLRKHLDSSGKLEKPEADGEQEEGQEFLDPKPRATSRRSSTTKDESAQKVKPGKASAINQDAARELPAKADEFNGDDEEEEPEDEEESKGSGTGKISKPSHGHAFQEIE